jgi:hypothetical protein
MAVLIVALAVAFLIGTTLVVIAAGSQTSAIAAEFETPGHVTVHDSVEAAQRAAPADGLVLGYAEVTKPGGMTTLVVARPSERSSITDLGLRGSGVTLGKAVSSTPVTLTGSSGSVQVSPSVRGKSILPPD